MLHSHPFLRNAVPMPGFSLARASVRMAPDASGRRGHAPRSCRVVPLAEIRFNDHNLNLTRYVQTDPPPPPIDVKAELATLQGLMAKRDVAEARMVGFLKELGYAG